MGLFEEQFEGITDRYDNCRSNGACYDWYAKQDGTCPVVMHRKNNAPWKVTMLLEDWIRLYAEGME